MNFENNFIFEPTSWEELRKKGIRKFVYIPMFLTTIISSIVFYFFDENTRGNLFLTLLIVLLISLIMFVVRLTTWYWKEYKFKRYTNSVSTYRVIDLIITIANMFRIVFIFINLIIIIIYVSRSM